MYLNNGYLSYSKEDKYIPSDVKVLIIILSVPFFNQKIIIRLSSLAIFVITFAEYPSRVRSCCSPLACLKIRSTN